MLGAIVHPYVQDAPGPQAAGLGQLLQESTRQPLELSTGSVAVFQKLCKETLGSGWEAGITPCCCAAIAVLWTAGTAGKQRWSLILPSSARVSELTYVTIIGTRYPELDNFQNDIILFGNYLQAEQCTRGGFLPIFWDAPYSYIHASTDIGEVVDWITDKFVVANKGDLAVLHNRNKMVNAFTNTEWVSGSGGAIISRSVTSCAGMTAYLVLLAQTRVGFLSGGRGKRTGCPKRRGICKGYCGPHSCTTDLLHHGPTGHAGAGWSSDYHWLLEIWCLLQRARRPGRPCFPYPAWHLMTRPFCKAYGSPVRE